MHVYFLYNIIPFIISYISYLVSVCLAAVKMYEHTRGAGRYYHGNVADGAERGDPQP